MNSTRGIQEREKIATRASADRLKGDEGTHLMHNELTRRIAKLARLVADARDLSEIETYFHHSIVPDPEFMAAGSPATHKPLQAIARHLASAYDCTLNEECRLLHLSRFSLWHGSLGNPLASMALLIYFDDQHRGIVSFGRPADPYAHRARFSLPTSARAPEVELEDFQLVDVSGRRGLA